MFEELINQYETLEEDDKKALLIYKSKLGKAINALNNNEEEVREIYDEYKKLLDESQNIFIKYTIFKDISFSNYESFKKSLITIKEQLNKAFKIVLPKDITVYRAISIDSKNKLKPISKDNIISTSLNLDECSIYLRPNKGYKHYLYQINLEKDSLVAICPYRILIYNNSRLVLTKRYENQEIILSKNDYIFEETISTTVKLNNNEELNIICLNAKRKLKDIKKKGLSRN